MTERESPRILLLGGTGQVGGALAGTLASMGTLAAPTRHELDLARPTPLRDLVRTMRPDVIVNAAAYTAVDAAEADAAGAQALNADLPALLAVEAARSGAVLVHFSTDYVFDGRANRPYREDDPPGPLNVYGRTKLAGDEAVLATGARAYIFRVAWVFGGHGRNFFRTIRRLADAQDTLRVVADQWGTPTSATVIASITSAALGRVLAAGADASPAVPPGLYHVAAPDHTTWHGFAEAIMASGPRPQVRVEPISTGEFPAAAERPRYSVMNPEKLRRTFGLTLPPWRDQLRMVVDSERAQAQGRGAV